MEETRIFNSFAKVAKDCSAVIVTHRLGSVRLADRILVMKDGLLVEEGRHETLVNAGGEYQRMYQAQAKWYAK